MVNSKQNEVLLIEIAQECYVSVRDIHFAAKDLGIELSPTARSVDGKTAKTLISHFQKKEEERGKIKKSKTTAKSGGKKIVIKKENKSKSDKKSEKSKSELKTKIKPPVRKEKFIIFEKQILPTKPKSDQKADCDKKSNAFKNQFQSKSRIDYEQQKKGAEKPMKSFEKKQNAIQKLHIKSDKKVYSKPEPLPYIEEKKEKVQKEQFFERKVKRDRVKQPKNRIKTDTTVSDELLGIKDHKGPRDTAELYDEMIAEEREREIVYSQRKMTAGKDQQKVQVKRAPTISNTVKYDPDRIVEIPDVITVKEFAEKTGLGAAKIIGELMKNGVLANINQQIDYDTAMIISEDLKVKLKKKQSVASAEDLFQGNLEALVKEHDSSLLEDRPPIVVVMGHVDHGKTKLLDFYRQTRTVEQEAGGITQHIGAYQVEKNGKKITFLDTPGHQAFTAMRARGAKVTDIAVLVVSADEGIKPQTLEALQHARDANVPIIVAITKIDKPNADIEKVKGELAGVDLLPEEWGGKTIVVPVSPITGQGMQDLLEMILLVAEMSNIKGNPNRDGVGTVIEANLDHSLGPVATMIVNTGTFRLMDNIVIGESYGRIKVLRNHLGQKIKTAGPSMPVFIAGLTEKPVSGDIVQVMPDEKTSRLRAITIKNLRKAQQRERGVGEIISAISSGQLKTLKIILKADTNGTLEALKQSISEIKNEDVGVKIILSGVGDVTDSDVMMAAASGGIVMGFNVRVNLNVAQAAERENVEVIHYNIIYKLLDDIKKILTGLLEPELVETELGELEVVQIFYSKKKDMIVGCKVLSGFVEKKAKLRLKRGDEILGEMHILSLQKNKETVNEVKEGNYCGLKVSGNFKIEEGDSLIPFKMEKKIRTL